MASQPAVPGLACPRKQGAPRAGGTHARMCRHAGRQEALTGRPAAVDDRAAVEDGRRGALPVHDGPAPVDREHLLPQRV